VIADIAVAQVSGLGWRGYVVATEALIQNLRERMDIGAAGDRG
jgi:3-dehydroquinate dehydratase